MQSLFNVIKSGSVVPQGSKAINTKYDVAIEAQEDNIKTNYESYENLARTMLENARKQSEAMLSKAFEEAQQIEREAYEKGFREGSEQGYRNAYEETLVQAQKEAELILENANNVLLSSKLEYERYLELKKEEIVQLSLNIAEEILKKQILREDCISEMVYTVLDNSRNTETIIIRANSIYTEELKGRAQEWKNRLGIKGDIFIIPDEAVKPGNAEIDKSNGRIVIGVDVGMESIRRSLMQDGA
jgi:flagellar assembly protein FliH